MSVKYVFDTWMVNMSTCKLVYYICAINDVLQDNNSKDVSIMMETQDNKSIILM